MTIVALFAVLLITVSAYSGRVYEAADGYKAPALTLSNSDTTLSLADLKGRYVVLAFWASNDAASRVEAGELDAFAMNADEEQFCLVSVNMTGARIFTSRFSAETILKRARNIM